MKIAPLRLLTTSTLLVLSSSCTAGFDLLGGPMINYPLLITSNGSTINAGHLGGGILVGASYQTKSTQFFPSLLLSFGKNRLPLHHDGTNVGALNFSFTSLVINGDYAIMIGEHRVDVYTGVGLMGLGQTGVTASGAENTIVSIDSSADITHTFPMVDVGIEYKGKPTGKKFYLSAGFSLNYVVLPEHRNTYYVGITGGVNGNYETQASFTGHLPEPTIYVALNYRSQKRKADNWYLE